MSVNPSSRLPVSVPEYGWRPRIYSCQQLEGMIGCPQRELWILDAYREVTERIAHKLFPCPFAKKSAKRSTQWFAFVESFAPASLAWLRSSLLEYVWISRRADPISRLLMPFVVLFHPRVSPDTLIKCHQVGWSVLQYLHDHDMGEWPVNVPRDPDDHLWSFCFHGVQLFVNFSCPRHARHRSRNLGSSMAFVINPRENFSEVAGNSPEGDAVRRIIRRRAEAYDGHPTSPALGTYGRKCNREWRQYALSEPGAPTPERCPLDIHGSVNDAS